jgi:hypothetical protein
MGIVLPLHMHHTFLCYVGLYQNTILKIARIVLEAYKNFDRAFYYCCMKQTGMIEKNI